MRASGFKKEFYNKLTYSEKLQLWTVVIIIAVMFFGIVLGLALMGDSSMGSQASRVLSAARVS